LAKELEQHLTNAGKKQEFKPHTILTTEDEQSFIVDALLDCRCTDTAINQKFGEQEAPFPLKVNEC
jgi:hypothetical protein